MGLAYPQLGINKRLIVIDNPSKETVDALTRVDLPSGVEIEIK